MKNNNEFEDIFSGATPYKGYGTGGTEIPNKDIKPAHVDTNPENFSEKVDPAFRGVSDFAGCGTGGDETEIPKFASNRRLAHFD